MVKTSEKPSALATLILSPLSGAIIVPITLPFTLFEGWVATVLWRWFVLPLFPSVPVPSAAIAGGLILLVSHIRAKVAMREEVGEEKPFLTICASMISWPVMILLAGWLLHLLVGKGW